MSGSRKYNDQPTASHPFAEIVIKAPRFNLVLSRLTPNTYVLVVLSPGEIQMECTRVNIASARERFADTDITGGPGGDVVRTDARTNGPNGLSTRKRGLIERG